MVSEKWQEIYPHLISLLQGKSIEEKNENRKKYLRKLAKNHRWNSEKKCLEVSKEEVVKVIKPTLEGEKCGNPRDWKEGVHYKTVEDSKITWLESPSPGLNF